MRIIKFRGKDISQDIWYEGSLYQDEMVSSIMFQKDGIDYNMIVDPETVAQFTGVTDMNGNEICEGDILEYEYNLDTVTKTKFNEIVTWDDMIECSGFTIHKQMDFKIIGNINDKNCTYF